MWLVVLLVGEGDRVNAADKKRAGLERSDSEAAGDASTTPAGGVTVAVTGVGTKDADAEVEEVKDSGGVVEED